ncbi:FAD-dependent oxidoreductase [Alkalihalobacterium chitinilyticum]|uniref:FAD-dependent oxidoreductase n=1 Tax=Alkalihalobacterium chitinilyticum TaxID=2980103 RepID=A0ABT5VGU0_9BACI|nr:FAD-dependent oxidoreductase [Alkalihalobacterium chitinilyticum]MDE5414680.1 FAD-dependent oxidoreductase [Alkalihalobacterium chitinilyticum]
MKYVIIGGDAAGMSAAMQIVRNEENPTIITLERGGYYSYAQCGLPYVVGGHIPTTEKLVARDVETFREKYKIDARTYHEVNQIDPNKKTVSGTNLKNNERFTIEYDKLLIATGADPVLPNWEGRDLKGIHTIKTIPDIKDLQENLGRQVKKATIIGGGYIGLEMAENLVDIGLEVAIIEQQNQLATIFDKDMANLIHDEAEKHGVHLYLNESVKSFEGANGMVQKINTDKQQLDTDLVIVAVGARPNTSFLKDTGLHFFVNGAIMVDAYMKTNLEDVWAAGDCATQFHRVKQKNDHIPLGTHANKQGRVAGLNMAGIHRLFKGVTGTSILKFFDLTLARTGLNETEAQQLGLEYEIISGEALHIAGYYPDPKQLQLKMIYDKATNRLLGAQVIGEAGVDKRIDVLSVALYHEMTVTELEDLDLAYAPPYNGVWDPIQQLARRQR